MVQRLAFAVLTLVAASVEAADWPRFRGPNGSGVAETTGLPRDLAPARNVVWKTALPSGHSSPIVVGDRIFLTASEGDELLTLCLRRSDGKEIWRRKAPRDRKESVDRRNGPASPSPAADSRQVVAFFGDYGLVAYDHDGRERWRAPLGPFQNVYGMGASPVLVDGLEADELTRDYFDFVDLDKDGSISEAEWKTNVLSMSAENGLLAFRLGGKGDLGASGLLWKYARSVPQLPTPLLYRGVLYMINDGGILTTLDPKTGAVLKQGRLRDAVDQYYASPVGGDGKVYFVSRTGIVSVLRAGPEQELLSSGDLEDEVTATPALVDGRIYLRTRGALYCFGAPAAAP